MAIEQKHIFILLLKGQIGLKARELEILNLDTTEISKIKNGKYKNLEVDWFYENTFKKIPKDNNMLETELLDQKIIPYLKDNNFLTPELEKYIPQGYEIFIKALLRTAFRIPKDNINNTNDPIVNTNDVVSLVSNIYPITNEFIGRKEIIKNIATMFEDGKKIVFLKGIGGIGKSYVALEYANKNLDKYDIIQHVFFDDDLKTTIKKLKFTGLKESELNDEELYNVKIQFLQRSNKKILLIIDNMNKSFIDMPEFSELNISKVNLLITTRVENELGEKNTIQVNELTQDEQLELFINHYKSKLNTADIEIAKRIFVYVGGHTLVIELIAKTMRNSDMTPKEMLSCLETKFNIENLDNIKITKDSNIKETTMYQFVRTLFDVSSLSDDEKMVLMNLSLVPLSGISRPIFKNLLKLNNNNIINKLIGNSWINIDEESDNRKIWLHQVISDVVIEKTIPTYEKCKEFFENILLELKEKHNNCCRIAYNACCIIDFSTLDEAKFLIDLALVIQKYSYYKYALEIMLKALEIYKNQNNNDLALELAKLTNDIAGLYKNIGNLNEAINHYLEAINISESALGKHNLDTASSYNGIAVAYRKMADYKMALKHYNIALKIREVNLDKNHPEIATTYNDIAIMHLNAGKLDESEEYNEKALQIRKIHKDTKPLDLAYSYNNLGTVYRKKEEYNEALEFHKKGLELRLINLDETHLDIATSYNNIGIDYEEMDCFDEAIEYYDKALQIRLEKLGKQHPDVAWSKNNIGSLKSKQGLYNEALEFFKEALSIRLNFVGQDHPYIATTLYNIGKVYYLQKDFEKAKAELEKAFNIQSRKLGKNHKDTIKTKELLDKI